MATVVPFDLDAWIAEYERRDPGLRRRVAERLAALLLEQDLIRLREGRRLSPAQLAHQLDVPRQAVQAAEFGGVTRLTVRRLLRHVVALGGRLEVRPAATPAPRIQARQRRQRNTIAGKAARARWGQKKS